MNHQSQQHNQQIILNKINREENKENIEVQQKLNIPYVLAQPHEQNFNSQFLDIEPQMMNKLHQIEQDKNKEHEYSDKLNKIPSITTHIHSSLQQKQQQQSIKRQFVNKLKQWQRQKQQLKIRKQQIQRRKQKQKQEIKLKKQKQQQQQKQFLKLQKQKQLQQKIKQIQQRRIKRQQKLKNNNNIKKSNYFLSYSQQQLKYKQQQKQQIQINLKLLKNKKIKQKIDPQQLKLHQKAYIQRIKQRLNMIPKSIKQQKSKSDFNLYLKRNQQKKQIQLNKILKMKKYQDKINMITIKINNKKKQQKQIEIDKIKNPQKYRLLSNKLLNDQQIFQQFKDFQFNIDRKQIGINYLKELKNQHQNHPIKKKRSNSQIIQSQPTIRLPMINQRQQSKNKLATFNDTQKTKSVELKPSDQYKLSLQKNKQRDSRYMKDLKTKLALAIQI